MGERLVCHTGTGYLECGRLEWGYAFFCPSETQKRT